MTAAGPPLDHYDKWPAPSTRTLGLVGTTTARTIGFPPNTERRPPLKALSSSAESKGSYPMQNRLFWPTPTVAKMPRRTPSPPPPHRSPQLRHQILKIRRHLTINRHYLLRSRMHKLKVRRMQRHPRNQRLQRFLRMILPIPNHRVPHRRKLRAYLILQARLQLHLHQRCLGKCLDHRIPQPPPGRLRILRTPELLKHSLPPKIMHQRPILLRHSSAHHRQIPPHRRVRKKLPQQQMPVRIRLRKQQRARRKPVDAMHNQRPLSFALMFIAALDFRIQQRQRRRSIRSLHRNRQQPSRLVDDDQSIVLINHRQLPRKTRTPPILSRPRRHTPTIRLRPRNTTLSRILLHRSGH